MAEMTIKKGTQNNSFSYNDSENNLTVEGWRRIAAACFSFGRWGLVLTSRLRPTAPPATLQTAYM